MPAIVNAALRVVIAVGHHKRDVSLCYRLNQDIYGLFDYDGVFSEFPRVSLYLISREYNEVGIFAVKRTVDETQRIRRHIRCFLCIRYLHYFKFVLGVKFQHCVVLLSYSYYM